MAERFSQFLDNICAQSTLGKLLLPMIFLFIIILSVIFLQGGIGNVQLVVIIAAIFAFYMAINIGANDVANNMGPAV